MCIRDRGKFGSRKLEEIYREEQLNMLKTLNDNLDRQLSLSASGINAGKEKKKYVQQHPYVHVYMHRHTVCAFANTYISNL